ncbi:MAG: hypothetical protein GF333_00665 [Candidatus Omnitrophica bacterium]|nr:hypothetical protein [Candidatus Omnitrophota bacterium]
MKKYVAALDCGTSTMKAGVFDLRGRLKGIASRECAPRVLPGGRYEYRPQELFYGACAVLQSALHRSKIASADVLALAVTNQRATCLCVDAQGRALSNAISWQDMRGQELLAKFRDRMSGESFYRRTGLPLNPVFSLSKYLWFRAMMPSLYRKAAKIVTLQEYFLSRFGSEECVVDYSNASLTGVLDAKKLKWDRDILKAARLSVGKYPGLIESGVKVGTLAKGAARKTGFLHGTPLISGGGDQQCAGVGAGAVRSGIIEITLGTVADVCSCTSTPVYDPRMRVMSSVHVVPGRWNTEGMQSSGGASLRWAQNTVNGGKTFSARHFRKVAQVPAGAGGLFFYPFLNGAAAPHWCEEAQALLAGCRHSHGPGEIVRAVMEGVAMETKQIFEVFSQLALPVREIRMTGGCASIGLWNQIHSDVCGKKVKTLVCPHATLLGAAVLAAYGIGAYPDVEQGARTMVQAKNAFTPVRSRVREYKKIFQKYRGFYSHLETTGAFKRL